MPMSLTYKEAIVFECAKGYRLRNFEDVVTVFLVTCQADGNWSPAPSSFYCESEFNNYLMLLFHYVLIM